MKPWKFIRGRKRVPQTESNPFMPETSLYRGLLKKLGTPRIPPALMPSQFFMGIVILTSGVASVAQGLDYIFRPQTAAWTLSVVERALPMAVWGWAFVIIAVIAVIGDTFRIWPFAIFGHGALYISYTALGVGVFASLALDWRGYGWQLGILYCGVGLFHAMVADGCYDQWAREWEKAPVLNSEEP